MAAERKAKTSKAKTTKRGRKALGDDPLDSLLQPGRIRSKRKASAAKAKTPRKAQTTSSTNGRIRATFYFFPELLDELRNTVMALSGPPEHLTLASLMQSAAERELGRLQKRHNKGKPFPRRKRDLQGGRPIGS